MNLTDIKKLKVPELRSRLKELGLDVRGLKAELVGRLWSALEAGQIGKTGEEELQVEDDTSPTPTEPAETADVRAPSSSPPTEAGVSARCKVDCIREFTDSATQTEIDAGAQTPQQGFEFPTACEPEHQAEEGDVEMQQGDAEDPGEERRAQGEQAGRGRAFYEFKEEIRYKR